MEHTYQTCLSERDAYKYTASRRRGARDEVKEEGEESTW